MCVQSVGIASVFDMWCIYGLSFFFCNILVANYYIDLEMCVLGNSIYQNALLMRDHTHISRR